MRPTKLFALALLLAPAFFSNSCGDNTRESMLLDRLEIGMSEADVERIIDEPLFLEPTQLFTDGQDRASGGDSIHFLSKPIYRDESGREYMYRLGFDADHNVDTIRVTIKRSGATPKSEIKAIDEFYAEKHKRMMDYLDNDERKDLER